MYHGEGNQTDVFVPGSFLSFLCCVHLVFVRPVRISTYFLAFILNSFSGNRWVYRSSYFTYLGIAALTFVWQKERPNNVFIFRFFWFHITHPHIGRACLSRRLCWNLNLHIVALQPHVYPLSRKLQLNRVSLKMVAQITPKMMVGSTIVQYSLAVWINRFVRHSKIII